LPDAAVAWTAPLPEDVKQQTVLYQMPWTNPRPGAMIQSIAVRYDDKSGIHGVPVVLAITAATGE